MQGFLRGKANSLFSVGCAYDAIWSELAALQQRHDTFTHPWRLVTRFLLLYALKSLLFCRFLFASFYTVTLFWFVLLNALNFFCLSIVTESASTPSSGSYVMLLGTSKECLSSLLTPLPFVFLCVARKISMHLLNIGSSPRFWWM